MSHLIQKHQQNNKGSGVIKRQYVTPEQAAEFERQLHSYATLPSDNTRVVLPRVIVASANTPEKVSKRRIAVQTNKAFKNAAKIDKERKIEQQYNQAAQDAATDTRWNPRAWISDTSKVPLFGLPATIAKALYAGGNYLTGNEGAAKYWWEDANRDAVGQTIGLGGIAAHMNPVGYVTGPMFDAALLGTYMKDLDEQGKLQNIGRLNKDDAAITAMSIMPFMRFENPRFRMLQQKRETLEPPPQEINLNTGEVVPGVTSTREGWEAISMNDFNNEVRSRLGRDLTLDEQGRILGEDLDIFSIRTPEGVKLGLEMSPQDMNTAKMRLLQYTDKNALRTRNLKNGDKPYELEELIENGKLKPGVYLDESKAGTHGRPNFFNEEDKPIVMANKYFNTKYSRPSRQDMEKILDENPFDRSGVLISIPDFHYSIDSFRTGLKNLRKNLSHGRKFAWLDTERSHSVANNYGQAARYIEEFTPEFAEAVKKSKSVPEGIKTFRSKDGTLIFQNTEGRVVGKLRPRSAQSIVDEYNSIIKSLNKDFRLNIKDARVNNQGMIEWPNIYGVLYKTGGRLTSKTYAKLIKH